MMRASKWSVRLGAMLLCFTSAIAAIAQEQEAVMDEIVVTATRTEVPAGELGVSATVITAEEIERRQTTDVLTVLRDVAGFNVIQSGSRGGLSELYPRGGESNYTMVLIDGVQVNEAGGGYDFANLTTDNIERIEIIRGPQSALYGSDAIGGVIHIFTKTGTGKPTATVSTAHGVHSENGKYIGEQKINISGGIKGSGEVIGFSLAYGRVDDLGILDVNNAFYNNTFSGRVNIYPHENADLIFTGRVNNSRYEFPTENGGDRPDSVFPGLDPDQYQDTLDAAFSGQGRFDLLPWWEHVLYFAVHRLDRDFRDPPNPVDTAFDAPPGSKSDSLETRSTFDYHMNLRFGEAETIGSVTTLGYEWDREDLNLKSSSTFVFGPPPFGVFSSRTSAGAKRTNHGYYLQEQLTLFDRLYLTGGFRVEDNSAFGTDVNPRGSIAFVIRETGTKIRGAIGTGIKEPTFLENFGGFGTIGNPDLKPEKSFSWEVGVDQSFFDDRVLLGFTYFQNDYEDMIAYVATPFPPPPVLPPNYFNIQAARSRGAEFSARFRPGFGLTIGGNYTYLDTEVTDDGGMPSLVFAEGEKLLRRPRHSGSFFINWLYHAFNIRLNGTYVGERDDTLFTVSVGEFGFYEYETRRLVNDDYFVLDAAASYTISKLGRCPLQSFKVFAKGRNVLDKDYEEALGYSSPRASFLGGVEFTF